MSGTRNVRARIVLEDLPPRPRVLTEEESSSLFGGCTGGCYPCENDKECCPGYSCRLGTKANCLNLPVAGSGSEVMVCLYG